MQTTPPRANDPETHLPYPQATLFEKLVGWAWKKWSRKLLIKVSAMIGPTIGMVSTYFGHTPSAEQAIGIGLSSLAFGLLDTARSKIEERLHVSGRLESLQKISEEQQAEEDQTTASELNWKEIFAAPAVPIEPRFKPLTIGGWTKPEPTEPDPIRATSRFGFSVEYESQGRKLTETFGTIGEAISFRDEVRLKKGHSAANLIKP